ncbi:MAG: hypothetical protein GH155_07020 [Spirochaeta sp.]|nr:hypothetical protein [Spirochaeta sp.]
MTILEKARDKFIKILQEKNISREEWLSAEPLGAKEALGDPAPYKDFALQRGLEKLVEVSYGKARGQAFTSFPMRWQGSLGEVLGLDLESDRNRALLVATMNAVGRYLNLIDGTIHCKNDGPKKCGRVMALELQKIIKANQLLGMVGYQPALLENLAALLQPENIRVVDLNPDNIGRNIYGLPIWDGVKDIDRLVEECTLFLVTGSALVNNTLDGLLELIHRRKKRAILFGTTIAFTASVLGLDRFCFEAK